jgi:predicted O-methyltransferase YrrM
VENTSDAVWAISLDHPIHPVSRWGFGRPVHPELDRLIAGCSSSCTAILQRCAELEERFSAIGRDYIGETDPYWGCGWLSPLDLMVLYSLAMDCKPSRYVEVGSGCSTTFVRRAIVDANLDTTIISIDPEPRASVSEICDTVFRMPLEDVDLGLFSDLSASDMVFIDGSHRTFTNSDATVAVLEVLPRLAPGVVVGFDDIYLPFDYPPSWADRFYSEQYLLAAWLLGGANATILSANYWACNDDATRLLIDDLLGRPHFSGLSKDGNGFWIQISTSEGDYA